MNNYKLTDYYNCDACYESRVRLEIALQTIPYLDEPELSMWARV